MKRNQFDEKVLNEQERKDVEHFIRMFIKMWDKDYNFNYIALPKGSRIDVQLTAYTQQQTFTFDIELKERHLKYTDFKTYMFEEHKYKDLKSYSNNEYKLYVNEFKDNIWGIYDVTHIEHDDIQEYLKKKNRTKTTLADNGYINSPVFLIPRNEYIIYKENKNNITQIV